MKKTLYKALSLGALAGMRSLSAPAMLSRHLSEQRNGYLATTPLHYLQNKTVANALSVVAATELLGDKVPGVPDRTNLPSLLMRAASGAVVGATVYVGNHQKLWQGAALGAAAAIAATYASFYLRKTLSEKTSMADPVVGTLEDALVLASGLQAARV